jgi:hypothetical protein
MDLFSEFATDKKAEVEGRWFEYADGGEFLIARWQNPKAAKKFEELHSRFNRHGSKRSKISLDQTRTIMIETTVHAVLLNWRNIEMQGKPFEYSKKAARKVLKEFPDFLDWVFSISNSMEAFKKAEDEGLEKN